MIFGRRIFSDFVSLSPKFVGFRFYSVATARITDPNVIIQSQNKIPPEKLGRKLVKTISPLLLDSDKLYVGADALRPKKVDQFIKLVFLYNASINKDEKRQDLVEIMHKTTSTLSSTFEKISAELNATAYKKVPTMVIKSQRANLFPADLCKVTTSSGEIVDINDTLVNAFVEGNNFHVGERTYRVVTVLPYVKHFKIASNLLVGFPLMPTGDYKNGARADLSSFYWFVESDIDEETIENSQKTAGSQALTLRGFYLKSTEPFYIPMIEDVGRRFCVVVVPRNETLSGMPTVVCPVPPIDQLENEDWLWSERHELCAEPAAPDALRIIDYNILAAMYVKSDFYSHCRIEFRDIDYRYPMLLGELLGYNGDLFCLQETETRFWARMEPFFEQHGFANIFAKKENAVGEEGVSILYRKDKLKLVESTHVVISKLIQDKNAVGFEDLAAVCKQQPETEKLFANSSAELQVALFQPKFAENVSFVVCNTHFHSDPKHTYIKLLQTALCLRYVEKFVEGVKKKQPSSKVGVIFCGDFNSTPEETVYRTMLTGRLSSDDKDWLSGSTGTKGIDFQTPLQFSSACCPVKYTKFSGPQGLSGCVDYIFVSNDMFEVSRRFPMPKQELVEKYTGLPSKLTPSDHLPIMCELKLKR